MEIIVDNLLNEAFYAELFPVKFPPFILADAQIPFLSNFYHIVARISLKWDFNNVNVVIMTKQSQTCTN